MDNSTLIKSGILIKKGHIRHNWKSRYFKLYEDNLSYFYDINDTVPIGMVTLRGASVIYPVTEYSKRESVFMVSPCEGRELLLQAPSIKEKDEWMHAISAVVRSLKSFSETRPISTIEPMATANFSDILLAMQDPDAGVSLSTREQDGIEYHSVFTGADAINWLLKWAFASDRREACKMITTLMQLAHILSLQNVGKQRKDMQLIEEFHDSPSKYYKFSSLNRTPSKDILDSGSSSEEEEIVDDVHVNQYLGKGKIVLEGFLMKKCINRKMRRKWKARRCVIRENPHTLEYYSTTKTENIPQRIIDLSVAEVVDTDGVSVYDAVLYVPKTKRRQHLFCIKVAEGRPILLQAHDADEKAKWVKALRSLVTHAVHF